MTELAGCGPELYAALEAETGIPTGCNRAGSLTLARTEERMIHTQGWVGEDLHQLDVPDASSFFSSALACGVRKLDLPANRTVPFPDRVFAPTPSGGLARG
jgi:hypothetical protein